MLLIMLQIYEIMYEKGEKSIKVNIFSLSQLIDFLIIWGT